MCAWALLECADDGGGNKPEKVRELCTRCSHPCGRDREAAEGVLKPTELRRGLALWYCTLNIPSVSPPLQITSAERAAQKSAARRRTAAQIASGQVTAHEAQLKAAPYSVYQVKVVDLHAAISRFASARRSASLFAQ